MEKVEQQIKDGSGVVSVCDDKARVSDVVSWKEVVQLHGMLDQSHMLLFLNSNTC